MANTLKKDIILTQRGIPEGGNVSAGKLSYQIDTLEDQAIVLYIEVPGVDPSLIDMQDMKDSLKITCTKGDLEYPIESSLDQSNLEASCKWGMLEVYIPRRQSRAVKIKITEK